jgi:stage V sporulation protein SpoVS
VRAGSRVVVIAIGPEPVRTACLALSTSRKYLADDGIDIAFRPEFTKVIQGDKNEVNAIKFIILAQQTV